MGWVVSAEIDALGGGGRAGTRRRSSSAWLALEALEAWVNFGCVRWVTANAAALGVSFWASSSCVAEAPAVSALGGGSG